MPQLETTTIWDRLNCFVAFPTSRFRCTVSANSGYKLQYRTFAPSETGKSKQGKPRTDADPCIFFIIRCFQQHSCSDSSKLMRFYVLEFVSGDLTLLSKKHVKRDEIEDKVIWITGASRGIGEVLAKQLAQLGAKLIISARNEVELQRVKKQLTGKHAPDEVMILPLDLTWGEEYLGEAVQKAESFFGGAGVDYMFHNAAFERPKSMALDVPEESLKATFDVNVLGPISLTKLLLPHMLKRGRGHFVVMSSAAGKAPAPGQAVYSASKFAVNGYFHTLRSELCRRGIKVTIVCPGPVKTSASTSEQKGSGEKRVSAERCAELTIIAASHGLKEAWISYQPVLAVLYLVQYMPTVGYWLMDKIGEKRVEVAAQKGNTYSVGLLFGKKKES
ncbi:Dehydrogenase/reductase SDR family member 7 [Sesamum angolense]|uniref:Dehydrogenase/reductase SDR family member 7 n=1 Tax=Sesamum angolense TaxID=2727404 RepID=A0AAE1X2L4_9LAMI|nr:Dehydrogenase/reductase SDR family member 7 [Sesamum angolense]